ncbi:UDP-N-acetylmuramoyl-tripeptide--D-alanyl-D-alanine ligase [Patescibacteria group bacterium]|nr:UDP-N-acetylmuramoyl-tripeptide--D-alanyl-D-alanine ligase [Patescibacteria group bacterium]
MCGMNKDRLKTKLEKIIRGLAILTIKRYQPGIIAVTGSVGKTSTKEAIYSVLKDSRFVRATHGNFNNEFGLPLTILGDYTKIVGKMFWVKVIFKSIFRLIFKLKYPEILILEYAADKPGDIKNLLSIAMPRIGVITSIGEIPSHIEFYSGPEAVSREKAKILEVLPSMGVAVLNADDKYVLEMKTRTKAHVMTYGFGSESEIQITNFENRIEKGKPAGISFKLNYGGSFAPIRIVGCFGKSQAYAVAAASAIGFVFGMNLVKISEALRYYKMPSQRGEIIPGIKKSFIIDDSYNASPASMKAAIELADSMKFKRKIAVLGDMLEIGKHTIEAHENIGKLIVNVFDILITVGPRSKFIAETASKKGFPVKNILNFEFADDAKLKVQEIIKKGDLILIKGSRALELEKVVEEIKIV